MPAKASPPGWKGQVYVRRPAAKSPHPEDGVEPGKLLRRSPRPRPPPTAIGCGKSALRGRQKLPPVPKPAQLRAVPSARLSPPPSPHPPGMGPAAPQSPEAPNAAADHATSNCERCRETARSILPEVEVHRDRSRWRAAAGE